MSTKSHCSYALDELENLQAEIRDVFVNQLLGAFPIPQFETVVRHLKTEWLSSYPIRGLLVKLGCLDGGRARAHVAEVATAVELAQLASSVIDDVIDQADVRNGKSAYRTFGAGVSVLAGDMLKSAASLLMIRSLGKQRKAHDTAVLQLFESTYHQVCVGQLMDIWFEGPNTLSTKRYLDLISRTTAGFLEGAAGIGVMLGTGSSWHADLLRRYARALGMALQIYDDVLDLLPQNEQFKPFGHDLRRRKQRLPLICYVHMCNRKARNRTKHLLSEPNLSDREVRKLAREIIQAGALSYAVAKGREFSRNARDIASQVRSVRCRTLMLQLVDFIQPENDEFVSEEGRMLLLRPEYSS